MIEVKVGQRWKLDYGEQSYVVEVLNIKAPYRDAADVVVLQTIAGDKKNWGNLSVCYYYDAESKIFQWTLLPGQEGISEMDIKKNSLIHKMYRLGNEDYRVSNQTNLCSLMTAICIKAPILCFGQCIVNFLGLLIGYKPDSFNPFNEKFYLHSEYKGLKVGSYEVYPWLLILIMLFVGLNIFLAIHTLIGLLAIDGGLILGLMISYLINQDLKFKEK